MILEERVGEWFTCAYPDPFMLKVYPFRPEKRGLFDRPQNWVVELTEYSLLYITFLGTSGLLRLLHPRSRNGNDASCCWTSRTRA